MTISPAPPRKKPLYRHWWVWVLGIVVLVVIAGALGGGSGSTQAGSAPAKPQQHVAQLGEPVRDGKFEFVVEQVPCDTASIGPAGFAREAQGEFCIARIKVTNIGDKSQPFSGSNVSLFNAEGQRFSADDAAAAYMDNAQSLYAPINPGNSLDAQVAFDVPPGTVVDHLELRDSGFSGGARVQVAP